MSTHSPLPVGAAGAPAWARNTVSGPGRLARAAAFRRSGGISQLYRAGTTVDQSGYSALPGREGLFERT